MKKKNMAIIMAGATVATSVAPIAAYNVAETEDRNYTVLAKDSAKLVDEVRVALNTKFTKVVAGNTVGESIYSVLLNPTIAENGAITGGTDVKTATDLESAINALAPEASLTVVLKDKGHQVLDGETVNYEFQKYDKLTDIIDAVKEANKTLVATLKGNTVEVKLNASATEKQTIILDLTTDKLDFKKPIIENNVLVGFEKLPFDIEDGINHIVKVEKTNAKTTNIDAEKLFDGIRLTNEGRMLAKGEHTFVIENMITDPGFVGAEKASVEIVISKDGKKVEILKVSSDKRSMIAGLVSALQNAQSNTSVIDVVAGQSRFETAINVSKESFENGKAGAVVLVGKDAVVDGLAAAPLAAAANAPILLSNVDGVNADTLDEITRVLGNTAASKTIYVVGGESNISKEAEEQLAKIGAKVKRLSGDDRYTTSLKIAEELSTIKGSNKTKAFVVGGKGEVDAMSIAAYASDIKAPIVVVNKDEVTEEAAKFMNKKELVIVGGESSVSEDVKDELKEIDKNVKRLSGTDRKATNAAVINEYYNNTTSSVYVAKDGYGTGVSHLVDALTAAPLAGKNHAPIVLATNGLSVNQEETMTKLTGVAKITQIGEGIAKTVVEKIVEIFNISIYKH